MNVPEYIVNETGCWIWQRYKDKNGYGKKTPYKRAHQFYWEQVNGPVPSGLELDHLCKNPSCVNPTHLEPVTSLENTLRGRVTKYTEDQVKEVRRLYATGEFFYRELAKMFNISTPHIAKIVTRQAWKHV